MLDLNKEVNSAPNEFKELLMKTKNIFYSMFLFFAATNILNLMTSFYALTVLDKAVGKQSIETLYGLVTIYMFIYFIMHLIQVCRSFVLSKTGEWLENQISEILFRNSIESISKRQYTNTTRMLHDFMVIRRFMTGNAITNIFDAPFSPLYLLVVFLLNTKIGILAIMAMVLSVFFGFFNTYITYQNAVEAQTHRNESQEKSQIADRNKEAIYVMGMSNNVVEDWRISHKKYMENNLTSSFRGILMSQFMSFFRQGVVQVYVTFLGAYTVITQGIGGAFTTGGMITSSILVGKALKPFDSFIQTYDEVNNVRNSYTAINMSFFAIIEKRTVSLENVSGTIDIEDVHFEINLNENNPMAALFGGQVQPKKILNGISMHIKKGEIIAILGASAAGKTTLAKLIVGLWQPSKGCVTLDGFNTATWKREDFGKHVGYLPQDIQLFQGTVSQNIARMDPDFKSEDVIKASKMARAHDVILRMQKSYDQPIGRFGANISGGQRQRVGLARAFYGNPKFVLLDEPNASLDATGQEDLRQAILEAKSNDVTTIMITHRTEILDVADKVAYLEDGRLKFFDTLQKFKQFTTNNTR